MIKDDTQFTGEDVSVGAGAESPLTELEAIKEVTDVDPRSFGTQWMEIQREKRDINRSLSPYRRDPNTLPYNPERNQGEPIEPGTPTDRGTILTERFLNERRAAIEVAWGGPIIASDAEPLVSYGDQMRAIGRALPGAEIVPAGKFSGTSGTVQERYTEKGTTFAQEVFDRTSPLYEKESASGRAIPTISDEAAVSGVLLRGLGNKIFENPYEPGAYFRFGNEMLHAIKVFADLGGTTQTQISDFIQRGKDIAEGQAVPMMEMKYGHSEKSRRLQNKEEQDRVLSDKERAPIEQKYEDMPTSTNIEDRRAKEDWVNYLSKEYTGFSKDQWSQVWDALVNRPWEPMDKAWMFMKLFSLKTNDKMAKDLGYEDMPVAIKKYMTSWERPDWWKEPNDPLKMMDEEQLKSGGKVIRPDFGAPGNREPSTGPGKVIDAGRRFTDKKIEDAMKKFEKERDKDLERLQNDYEYYTKWVTDLYKGDKKMIQQAQLDWRVSKMNRDIEEGRLTPSGQINDPYGQAVQEQIWNRMVQDAKKDLLKGRYKVNDDGTITIKPSKKKPGGMLDRLLEILSSSD